MHTGCWLRKLKEKILKSNKCGLEDNTKMNIKEIERVLEFLRLRKGKISTIFNMVVKSGPHQ
jgi:hypothetical protein